MKIQFNTEEEALTFKENVIEAYKNKPIALIYAWNLEKIENKFYYEYIFQLNEFINQDQLVEII